MPKKLTPENKQKVVDDVVDFLCNYEIEEDNVDDSTMKSIAKLAGIDMPRGIQSPRQKCYLGVEENGL